MKKLKKIIYKLFYLALLGTFLIFLGITALNLVDKIVPAPKIERSFGVTFAPNYATELGLNPETVYQQIIDELKIKKLRLPVYWDQVEPSSGQYNFIQVDKMLDLAKKNQIQVILALGYKVPRWPECYPPKWAKNLTNSEKEQKILDLIEASISHFKNRSEITAWQIENEPTVNFGICTLNTVPFLEKEIKLAKSLDSRPVITTDSGELSYWIIPMQSADLFGTTLYRRVYDKYFGYTSYPYPPLFYRIKQFIIKNVFARNSQGIFISELQAEPWPPAVPLAQLEPKKQAEIFNVEQFQGNVLFAQKTGFMPAYLWGVEWWYYMKTQGYPEYWEYAKTLF